MLDIKSLPERIADPERRSEPWSFVHNVGSGDYRVVGDAIVGWLQRYGGLEPSSHVLDIGCGTGRAALRLQKVLSGEGRYLGFDIAKAPIRSCEHRFQFDTRFSFAYLDIWNGDYNRAGATLDIEATFPAAADAYDVAFATSVFTHMRLPAVLRYLNETARTLRPGGKFLFTTFTLEPGRLSSEQFPFTAFGESSAVIDPKSPERAIGHTYAALEAGVRTAGLDMISHMRGGWCGRAEYDGGQDLWVVEKPVRPRA